MNRTKFIFTNLFLSLLFGLIFGYITISITENIEFYLGTLLAVYMGFLSLNSLCMTISNDFKLESGAFKALQKAKRTLISEFIALVILIGFAIGYYSHYLFDLESISFDNYLWTLTLLILIITFIWRLKKVREKIQTDLSETIKKDSSN